MIRRLIFDMDGTLADTAKATVPACVAMAKRNGLPVPTPEAVRGAIGIANPDFYYHLFPDFDRVLISAYGQQVERDEAAFVHELGQRILFAGVRDMLEDLRSLGCELYIASTGDAEHVNNVLACGGIRDKFAGIHCGQSEKVGMVRAIIGDTDKSEWAMVGDREKDVSAARGNGICAIGAGFGYCEPKDWRQYDEVFETPQALTEWMKKGLNVKESEKARGFS